MKRIFIGLSVSLVSLAFTASVMAAGISPYVVEHPDMSNKAVALEVGGVWEDLSWMHIGFDEAFLSDYQSISVSFDIYRIPTFGHWLQNLRWSWNVAGTNPSPIGGFQWDHWGQPAYEPWTYPFYDSDEHAITQTGRWTNLTLEYYYDSVAGVFKANSSYDNSDVDLGFPVSGINSFSGFNISLGHEAATGNGLFDIAWIDNLLIFGEKAGGVETIYDSEGFEGFSLGGLNGQDGWAAGAASGDPVPIPAAIWLLGSGLVGLLGLKRRLG